MKKFGTMVAAGAVAITALSAGMYTPQDNSMTIDGQKTVATLVGKSYSFQNGVELATKLIAGASEITDNNQNKILATKGSADAINKAESLYDSNTDLSNLVADAEQNFLSIKYDKIKKAKDTQNNSQIQSVEQATQDISDNLFDKKSTLEENQFKQDNTDLKEIRQDYSKGNISLADAVVQYYEMKNSHQQEFTNQYSNLIKNAQQKITDIKIDPNVSIDNESQNIAAQMEIKDLTQSSQLKNKIKSFKTSLEKNNPNNQRNGLKSPA